jgi:hypothetical protein
MGCCASRDVIAAKALPTIMERMQVAYDKPVTEVGMTSGHFCLTDRDKAIAMTRGASLLYGELLPAGATRILDARHLDAAHATHLIDLGMGTGKLALQGALGGGGAGWGV